MGDLWILWPLLRASGALENIVHLCSLVAAWLGSLAASLKPAAKKIKGCLTKALFFQNMSLTEFLPDAHGTNNGYSQTALPGHAVVSTRSQSKEPGQASEEVISTDQFAKYGQMPYQSNPIAPKLVCLAALQGQTASCLGDIDCDVEKHAKKWQMSQVFIHLSKMEQQYVSV